MHRGAYSDEKNKRNPVLTGSVNLRCILFFFFFSFFFPPLSPALAAEYIGLDGGAVTYVGDRNALGEPHGAGDMLSAAGAKLQGGSWEGGLLHGKGYAASSDQSVYTGEFSRGMMHGEGELLWSDGDTFTGRFADDKRAGFGTMRHASDGSVYEGEWRDDSMHGHGVIVWQQDGAVCEANFRNNDRHGFGAVWNGQGLLVGLGKWEEDELVESGPVRTDWFTDGRVLTRGGRNLSKSHARVPCPAAR